MTPVEHDLLQYLQMMDKIMQQCGSPRPDWTYDNPCAFLRQHGRWYHPRPLPASIHRGLMGHCYGNSINAAVLHGLRYVEGYALLVIPVEHAWCCDMMGRLYEVTWPEPGLAYYGIEFSVERADDATWNGDASVLWDYLRGHPLLRQPWTGEDWTRQWPPSPRLEAIRTWKRGDQVKALTQLKALRR